MKIISVKLNLKFFIIFGFALFLGFFLFPVSGKAQCSNEGESCNPGTCCSGLECSYHKCHRPLGASCGGFSECCPTCTEFMGCAFGKCCGRHFFPCGNDNDCCQDPGYAGAFYCTSTGYCAGNCGLYEYGGYCTDWTNQGCGKGGCATDQIYKTRTCTNVVCNTSECKTSCSCNTTSYSACYNDDRYWYDACGTRTNNVREDCANDTCGSWYDCTATKGCYDTRHKKDCQDCFDRECSNDACFSNPYTNTRQGADCGVNTSTNNYRCSGSIRQQEYLNQGCANSACYSTSTWNNVQDCGANYCGTWAASGCNGNYIQETRTCHNRGCNNGACYDNTYIETRNGANCDASDACVGTTYRDFSCSGGTCTPSDSTCDARCENPPSVPTFITPPNNSWINYDPTFQVRISDLDGENVRAHFNVLNFGSGIGNWVSSGGTSQWGPVNLGTGNCFENWWQARTEDACLFFSNWSGWWRVRIDKDLPTASISYPTGVINSLTLAINLSDSDDCSGVAERDLEISIDNGAWQDYSTGGASLNYIGSYGHTYKFRYRARDVAGNWSDYTEGGIVELKALPTANPSNVNWIFCPNIVLELSWNYSDINNLPQISFQIQIDNNSDFSSPLFDSQQISDSRNLYIVPQNIVSQLMNQIKYYWRIRTQNSAGDWSSWNSDLNLPIFFKKVRDYSTFF